MTEVDLKAFLPVGCADAVKQELVKFQSVQRAILFGSRAMGTQRPNSDIDLCLDARCMAFNDFLSLSTELEERFFPYSLDLVLRHQIENPELLDHIQRVGVTIYERV